MEYSVGDYIMLSDKRRPAIVTRVWKETGYFRVEFCDRNGSLMGHHVQEWLVSHPTVEEMIRFSHVFKEIKDKLRKLDKLDE